MEDRPLITIYRPVQQGTRMVARADIKARGEEIELQVTASDALARRARDWYNRAAAWAGRWLKYVDHAPEPGRGVFADLPQVAHELAKSRAIYYDEDATAAAELYLRLEQGDPVAQQQLEAIVADAPHEAHAAEALELIQLCDCARRARHQLPMQRVFCDAAHGDRHAHQVLATLRELTPPEGPVRLSWHQDEYLDTTPERIAYDVAAACADEIGARLVTPTRYEQVRFVRPHQAPMMRTFQRIAAAYGS